MTEDLPGRRATIAATRFDEWERDISARRGKYLGWIIDEFGKLEQEMKPLDGRAWSLNQARLFLNRDTDTATSWGFGC